MSFLFNARLAKCLKRIFPVVKHISINNNKWAIAFPNSKQSVLTSIRYILPNRTVDATKSIVFGFSLLGLIDTESETNRQLVDTVRKGLSYLRNGDYNAFEQTLHEALKIANDLNNFDGVTLVYDVLANGAFVNEDYEKAKDLFTKVVNRLIDQGRHKDDLNVLYIGLKICKIYEIQKDYEKLEIGYTLCLESLEKRITIDPENREVLGFYATTIDTYGHYLKSQGQNNIARICFKKAYKAFVKLNGEIFETNVILLNDLGTLYCDKGKLNKAFQHFRKAEQIGQHFSEMEILSMVYINLGNIYLKQGMLKDAEKNCVEGMKRAIRNYNNEWKKEAKICLAEIENAMK